MKLCTECLELYDDSFKGKCCGNKPKEITEEEYQILKRKYWIEKKDEKNKNKTGNT